MKVHTIAAIRQSETSTESRFWAKVRKSDGCWEWTAATKQGGYGRFNRPPRLVLAHRYSYELANGPIPAGLFVCHRCDNPPCVRPEHLFLGTALDNSRDAKSKGRKAGGPRPRVVARQRAAAADRARAARELMAAGLSQLEVAARLGVHNNSVDRWFRKYSA